MFNPTLYLPRFFSCRSQLHWRSARIQDFLRFHVVNWHSFPQLIHILTTMYNVYIYIVQFFTPQCLSYIRSLSTKVPLILWSFKDVYPPWNWHNPENGSSQKETSIPTIRFQVLLLLVSGRVSPLFLNSLCSKPWKKNSPLLVLPVWCRTNETSMDSRMRAAELPSGSGIFSATGQHMKTHLGPGWNASGRR